MAIFVEGLGGPDEIAFSLGRHRVRKVLDGCGDEGSAARLELVDGCNACQARFVTTAHPLAKRDSRTIPVDFVPASKPVRCALEVLPVLVYAEIAVFAWDL